MTGFVAIDGSEGEGGGQVLRSSLTLSLLTGRPFRIDGIRANRPKPGLAAQHLACVRAAAAISGATYKGGALGSTTLYFEPGRVQAGEYRFAIGTAGATGLLLQTVHLPLALRGGAASRVEITGGTHVPHAPCFHFLELTWAGYMARLGLPLSLAMERPGFYPRGGGVIAASIEAGAAVRELKLVSRPVLDTAGGFSAAAGLPAEVARRQERRLSFRLGQEGLATRIRCEEWSNGIGTVAAVELRQCAVPTLLFALGERGKPAERVADDAADQAIAYIRSGAAVDAHSADQIVLPLAFAGGASEFTVSEVTTHLLTNVRTISKFVERQIDCEGEPGEPGRVAIAAA